MKIKAESWTNWFARGEDPETKRRIDLRASAGIDDQGRTKPVTEIDISVQESGCFPGPKHSLTLTLDEIDRIFDFLCAIGARARVEKP